MKPRTESQLIELIDQDLIWRKRELTQLKFLLADARGRKDRKGALLRSAVTLLYAHWEGFIKATGSAYLEYVASQRLRFNELSPPFLALAARKILSAAAGSGKIKAHIQLARFFQAELSQQSSLPYKDGINTQSNLSSDVLREIVDTLGLEFEPYEMKRHLIDVDLVAARNAIAHGEHLLVTETGYDELSKDVLAIMEGFRTQVQNATVVRSFRLTG